MYLVTHQVGVFPNTLCHANLRVRVSNDSHSQGTKWPFLNVFISRWDFLWCDSSPFYNPNMSHTNIYHQTNLCLGPRSGVTYLGVIATEWLWVWPWSAPCARWWPRSRRSRWRWWRRGWRRGWCWPGSCTASSATAQGSWSSTGPPAQAPSPAPRCCKGRWSGLRTRWRGTRHWPPATWPASLK